MKIEADEVTALILKAILENRLKTIDEMIGKGKRLGIDVSDIYEFEKDALVLVIKQL